MAHAKTQYEDVCFDGKVDSHKHGKFYTKLGLKVLHKLVAIT